MNLIKGRKKRVAGEFRRPEGYQDISGDGWGGQDLQGGPDIALVLSFVARSIAARGPGLETRSILEGAIFNRNCCRTGGCPILIMLLN